MESGKFVGRVAGTQKLGSGNTHILYYNVSYWGESRAFDANRLVADGARCGSDGTITV